MTAHQRARSTDDGLVRVRMDVRGIVQGVGFRPAVHRLASRSGLAGVVGNDDAGVFIEVQGARSVVEEFLRSVVDDAPPMAVIEATDVARVPTEPDALPFRIVESRTDDVDGSRERVPVALSPDVAPCDACLAELTDPADRRHRHPFISCTDCGPRLSITQRTPFDRSRTTMAGFGLCARCAAEYADPADRRHHAQTIACRDCGPQLEFRSLDQRADATTEHGDAALGAAVRALRQGLVVAVKGVGGYHLAADACDEAAVRRLRAGKHRGDKPFAVLVADLASARAICEVADAEAALLAGPDRPIVLLPRRPDSAIASAVAPGNATLGLVLPPSPLHALLAADFGGPLVLTSANRSEEPIVHVDDGLDDRLAGLADAVCGHDRAIHTRVDDSVVRSAEIGPVVLRRARGLAPRPFELAGGVTRHVLACGAERKVTVAVGRDRRVFVSPHIGDLGSYETLVAHEHAIDSLCDLFDVHPEVVAHDLHPDFASTDVARRRAEALGAELVGVQHHHAHIASCLVDNGYWSPVIGVAFDGLGLGTDGAAWGGEILHVDGASADRLGHLRAVPMPGGDAAVREPWRMAAMHAATALEIDEVTALAVHARHVEHWDTIQSMASGSLNAPLTSSVGRLFDAVAALIGVRDVVTYEGQAAIELEQLAGSDDQGSYPGALAGDEPFVVDTAPIIRGIADDLAAGTAPATIAARFHNTVVEVVVAACRRARRYTGLDVVALSGGVFQNVRLLDGGVRALSDDGFRVLTHRRLPPNDGGISAGQVAIVAARDQRSSSTTR